MLYEVQLKNANEDVQVTQRDIISVCTIKVLHISTSDQRCTMYVYEYIKHRRITNINVYSLSHNLVNKKNNELQNRKKK